MAASVKVYHPGLRVAGLGVRVRESEAWFGQAVLSGRYLLGSSSLIALFSVPLVIRSPCPSLLSWGQGTPQAPSPFKHIPARVRLGLPRVVGGGVWTWEDYSKNSFHPPPQS